jgi:TPR repeat protein
MTTETQEQSLDLVRAAAISGVHQAQLMFGQMLLDGKLIERNPTWALHWFERAAKGGNLMAVNMVGRCHDQGWGTPHSAALAEQWFRKAAERGLDWGMYNLATLLTLGEGGVTKDRLQALVWFRRAADLGHAKSMNILGGFYEDGWEVRADRATALAFYRKAADGGDFRGQFNLARLLAEDGDTGAAIRWLRQVPLSATPAFLLKMKQFLQAASAPALQAFAATLPEPQNTPVSFEVR